MSTTVSVNGSNFEVPSDGERGWGQEVSNLLIELAEVSLLIKGGSIPLTSEADFGTNFGLKAPWFKTATTNPASAGVLRLATTDTIKWRNGANNGDVTVDVSSDRLRYQSTNIPTISSSDIFTNKTIDAALNTLSNIDTTMWASGVLNTSTSLTGASNLNVPSTLAIKSYTDTAVDLRALKTTTVTGTGALTGGGDLSANRTLDVAALGITAGYIASDAVTTAKILNSNVTSAKLEDNIVFPGVEKVRIPVGTTAQRPSSPVQGDIRRNTTLTQWEGYNGSSWESLGGGGGSTTANYFISYDDSTEAGSVTVAAGTRRWESEYTIKTGDTWTVSSGGRLAVEGLLTLNGTLTVNGNSRVF